jgi:hypothetical protein
MSKLENQYSLHHILPKSKGGSGDDNNIEYIKNSKHRALHTLFDNKMIAEQLLTTIDLSAKALREDVRRWLIDILTIRDIHNPYEWYKEDTILIPKHK